MTDKFTSQELVNEGCLNKHYEFLIFAKLSSDKLIKNLDSSHKFIIWTTLIRLLIFFNFIRLFVSSLLFYLKNWNIV